MKIIERASYIEQVEKLLGKGEVVVLTGHRRAGKSCILEKLAEKLASKGHVIYLDMEDPDNAFVGNYVALNEYIKTNMVPARQNFLLIDEVQEIDGFEKTLRFWAKQDHLEIIATGSNAYMLSGELATIFAGRHSQKHVYSLDFEEYMHFYGMEDCDETLVSYLRWGGLPFLHQIPLDDERSRTDYLGGIYNTIFIKDIVQRRQVRNITLLDNLARFLADNCGKVFSANSISKYLKNSNVNSTANTISEYVGYLCDAYLIDRVTRYDINGKRAFEQQEKFYFEDIGIRNYLCNNRRQFDIEKVMENTVYLRLKQLGYDVYVGQWNGKEIDFVAKLGDDIRYIQVTKTITSEETYVREYGNLKLIKDNYPKYVVTMDPIANIVNDDGIITCTLRDFLKKRVLA
ncbi:MAG: ATP-binding protein [Bacteroidales bacterium]|nr:ATP-binding protein [Bacteroidales bacterium]